MFRMPHPHVVSPLRPRAHTWAPSFGCSRASRSLAVVPVAASCPMSSTRPRNLTRRADVQARARRVDARKLYAGDQLFETLEARCPLRPLCAAGDPGARLCELSRRRDRRSRRRVRPLHPHVSQQPECRLRLLSQRASSTSARTRDCSVTCTSSTWRSASPRACANRFAAFKELVAKFPGQPLRAGRDRPDALPHECARRSTK